MGFLGLDLFKTKEQLDIEQKSYNLMIFPFGDKQKETITQILKELFKGESIKELIYDYVVTKQEIKDKDIYSLSKQELIDLTSYLQDHYITNGLDVFKYLALANIDANITSLLDYPKIEEIKSQASILKTNLN